MRLDRIAVAAVAVLTLASSTVQAQTETRSIRFGLLAGMSMSDFSDLGIADVVVGEGVTVSQKKRTGLQMGAFVNFALNDYVSIQPEIHLTRRGMGFDISQSVDPDIPVGAEVTIHTTYVELSLYPRFDLMSPESSVRPFLFAGPYVGLRGGCEIGLKLGDASVTGQCDEDTETGGDAAEDPISKTDFGGTIGGGLGFRFAGLPMSVQARYSMGFKSVFKDEVEGVEPKNGAIAFLFGIGF